MATDMSQHFTLAKLIKFATPSIGMMVFMSAYTIVDGFFVSNFCGSTALAAVNFSFPIPMILGTIGFMMGTGGSAIVAHTRGAGDDDLARRQFSMLVYAAIAAGIAFAVIGLVVLEPVLRFLGARGDLLTMSMAYATILVAGIPFTVLQYLFQELLVTAGKPGMGFGVTVASGIANIALDALLIVAFGLGVRGAAVGTMVGEAIGGIIPLAYFARKSASPLRLVRTAPDWRVLAQACTNGASEMVSNIAISVVAIAYNVQLLAYLGNDGVAAYSVIAYVGFAFASVFLGFSIGTSPLMSYQHGARKHAEMQSLFKKSLASIGVCGIVMFAATRLLEQPLASLFVSYDPALMLLTEHALGIYCASFLVMGFNVYASALFTSLGNGLVSATISFFRSLVCELGAVFLLPLAFGPDGIWYAVLVAELAALALSAVLVVWLGNDYRYLPERR